MVKRILFFILLLLLIFIIINVLKNKDVSDVFVFEETVVVEGPYEKISISGENSHHGVFDPSIEYDENGVGWMAYSSINTLSPDSSFFVQTEMAKSLDNGKTWSKVSTINPTENDTVTIKGESVSGHWNKETPGLVYDPADPNIEKRWKLFSHRIFSLDGKTGPNNLPEHSMISYRTAPSPDGPWSNEELLFGTSKLESSKISKHLIDNLHPDLKSIAIVTEPGPLSYGGVIFLSLNAFSNKDESVVLIKSEDHGESWKYVNTIIDKSVAEDLGYVRFDHTSLANVGEEFYLIAAPKKNGKPQDGTFIFKFVDLNSGNLVRENGRLKIYTHLKPQTQTRAPIGEGEYHELNTGGGVVFPEIYQDQAPEIFQIYNTNYLLP